MSHELMLFSLCLTLSMLLIKHDMIRIYTFEQPRT